MTLSSKLGFIAFIVFFFAMILFVLVGQITVRRLRKNPETKHLLGVEFASGLDILNVACALSRPKCFSDKMRNSPLAFMGADERPLYAHTNRFERVLARMLFWCWAFSSTLLILILILTKLGVLD